ncbi:MAG TPA: hypothetical protein PLO16_00615 [Acidocella sp.]|nr:hypothetical protein [Acidocella sp.]
MPVPLDVQNPVITSLQFLFGSTVGGAQSTPGYSDSIAAGKLYLQNADIATVSGPFTFAPNSSGLPGIYELTNYASTGATVAGSTSITGSLPANYQTLIVEAPGATTINGNGSDSFLGVIGRNSPTYFNTEGGSGTVIAGGAGDYVGLEGTTWNFIGSTDGGDTINTSAANSAISVFGSGTNTSGFGSQNLPSNVVGIVEGNVSVNAYGTNDLVAFNNGTGSGYVTVDGSANILVNGGFATVDAAPGSGSVNAFFAHDGGTIDFINNSGGAQTVSGDIQGAIGGSATVFGGAGGGYYQGGVGGNNSLVGGSGAVTLIGAGSSTYELAASSVGGGNALFADSAGGSTTMIGAVGSGNNLFAGSTGSLVVSTRGAGTQSFFVGASGQENLTGSTVSGAQNNYYFLQDSTGSGSDIITNFNIATDNLFINPFSVDSTTGANTGGVNIVNISQNFGSGGGVIVSLSDSTTIKLYGVSLTAADAATQSGGVYHL